MKEPIIKHVSFKRLEGHYNLLDPSQKSAQYIFKIPHLTREQINELDLQTSFTIPLDDDPGMCPKNYTALEALYEIKHIYDGYLFHSSKEKLQKFIDYLESIEEEQEKLRHQYEIEYAKYQIHYWEQEKLRHQYEIEYAKYQIHYWQKELEILQMVGDCE